MTSRHSRKHRQRQCGTQTHIRARGHFNILVSVKCVEPTKCIQRFIEEKRRRRRRRRGAEEEEEYEIKDLALKSLFGEVKWPIP